MVMLPTTESTSLLRTDGGDETEKCCRGGVEEPRKRGILLSMCFPKDPSLPRQVMYVLLGIFVGLLLGQHNATVVSDDSNSAVGNTRGGGGGSSQAPEDHRWNDMENNATPLQDQTLPSTNAQYAHFQALNFQLYTGGAPKVINNTDEDIHANPECHDGWSVEGTVEGESQCYMGHENTTQDVYDRLAVMKDAVERAYKVSVRSDDTLKVFVAPEFFFRGRQGAYVVQQQETEHVFAKNENGDCDNEICHILQGLQDMVADARFKDWLFLFGTVIVSEELPTEDDYDYLFYNFGLLYKGYDPAEGTHYGKRFLIPKRYVSTSDFLTPRRSDSGKATLEIFETAKDEPLQKLALQPTHKKYDRNLWHAYKDELTSQPMDYIMIEYGWLQMDGITMTVEICLDHDLRSALTAFLVDSVVQEATLIPSSHARLSSEDNGGDHEGTSRREQVVEYVDIPRHQAQLSLVSSAGMTVNEPSLALAHQGSIILQDGLESSLPSMSYEFTCDYRHEWEFVGGSEVIQRNATLTPTEVVFQYKMHDHYQKLSIYCNEIDDSDCWKDMLRGVFSNSQYEPMISVFEPLPIAQVF